MTEKAKAWFSLIIALAGLALHIIYILRFWTISPELFVTLLLTSIGVMCSTIAMAIAIAHLMKD